MTASQYREGGMTSEERTVIFASSVGNIYSSFWYPIVAAAMSLVAGLIFLPETKDRDIT